MDEYYFALLKKWLINFSCDCCVVDCGPGMLWMMDIVKWYVILTVRPITRDTGYQAKAGLRGYCCRI